MSQTPTRTPAPTVTPASAAAKCPRCAGAVPAGAPEGLCPACLLAAGLAAERPTPGRFASPSPEALAPLFRDYEVLERIGAGGMGAVYRARHRKLDRLVALKVLAPELAADPEFAERFHREARTIARLDHPGIVRIFDFGEAGPHFYLALELVERNLREVMAEGLKPRRVVALLSQVAAALEYAHAQGVVHRDVKPENILVDDEGRARVADFGLAKIAAGDGVAPSLTGSDQALGTPHYIAPEQLEHPSQADHRVDIFALGVMGYEMLTGELPLGRFGPPSSRSKLDRRLDAIIMRCLERDADARFATMADVRRRLDELRRALGSPAAAARAGAARPGRASPEPEEAADGDTMEGDGDAEASPRPATGRERKLLERAIACGLVGLLATLFPWMTATLGDYGLPSEFRGVTTHFLVHLNAYSAGFSVLGVDVPCWLVGVEAGAIAGLATLALLGRRRDPGGTIALLGGLMGAQCLLFLVVQEVQLGPLVGLAAGVVALATGISLFTGPSKGDHPKPQRPAKPLAARTRGPRR